MNDMRPKQQHDSPGGKGERGEGEEACAGGAGGSRGRGGVAMLVTWRCQRVLTNNHPGRGVTGFEP